MRREARVYIAVFMAAWGSSGCGPEGNGGLPRPAAGAASAPACPVAKARFTVPHLSSSKARKALAHFYPVDDLEAFTLIPNWRENENCMGRLFTFEGPVIYGAARISERMAHWAALLNSPDAEAAFTFLLTDPDTPTAGRLYALCGLYWMDRKAFTAALEQFKQNRSLIQTQVGCVGESRRVCDIVYDPKGRRDIASGGWPVTFLAHSRYYSLGGMTPESFPQWKTPRVGRWGLEGDAGKGHSFRAQHVETARQFGGD